MGAPWKNDPLKLPHLDKVINNSPSYSDGQYLELYDIPENALMGGGAGGFDGFYIVNLRTHDYRVGAQYEIDVPFNVGPEDNWLYFWLDNGRYAVYNYQRWGHPKTHLKEPNVLRVVHYNGWNNIEHYPLKIAMYDTVLQRVRTELDTSQYESIFLENVGLNNIEKGINYYGDLNKELNDLAKEKKLIFAITAGEIEEGYNITGPYNQDRFHSWGISRWMYNIVPRYQISNDRDSFWTGSNFASNIRTGPMYDITRIKGGKLYVIYIVSDGMGAYHGCTYDGEVSQIPSSDYFSQDIEYYNSIKPYYEKIGGCIVNSLKNSEFFPMWSPQNVVDNTNRGRAFSLPDAQSHLRSAVTALGENWSLLMRNIQFVAPPPGGKHELLDDDRGHIVFTGSQIPISSIVDAARAFFES